MCKHILDGSEFQVNGENMHLWVVKKVEVFIVTVFFFFRSACPKEQMVSQARVP